MKQSLPSLIACLGTLAAFGHGRTTGEGSAPGGAVAGSAGPVVSRPIFVAQRPGLVAAGSGFPAFGAADPNVAEAAGASSPEAPEDARAAVAAGNGRSDSTAGAPATAPPPGERLVEQAFERLARRRSIVAKVRHRAQLFDREIIGSGEYAQGPASSRLVRFDLRTQVGDQVFGRLQVSDGQFLWIVDQFKGDPDLARIDVDRVVATLEQQRQAERDQRADPAAGASRPAGAAAPRPAGFDSELALGGLSQLLAALGKDFRFEGVHQAQLGNVRVYGVEGTWRHEVLAKLLPAQAAAAAGGAAYGTQSLAAHVPDRIVLFLGTDDLFPYRIEYRRSLAADAPAASSAASTPSSRSSAAADGSPAAEDGTQADSRLLLTLEFFEVRFDVLLEDTLFLFAPGARPYVDVTDTYLARRKAIP